jgi:hypothetical protein
MKCSLALAALLLIPLAPHAAQAQSARPNVIVFLVDDMGVMDTSVPFLTDQTGAGSVSTTSTR